MTNTQGADRTAMARWAPFLAAATLVVSLIVAGWAYFRDQAHADATARDNALLFASERLLATLTDIETGQRGYIITGDDAYLDPYRKGLATIGADQNSLRAMLGPESAVLDDLVTKRIARATATVEAYRARGGEASAMLIREGVGKAQMDATRQEIDRIQRQSRAHIAAIHAAAPLDGLIRAVSVAGCILSCLVLGLLAMWRRREMRASQSLFEGVLENAPVGLGILDRDLRIRHINHALSKMSERALSAQPGMSIWDVVPQLRQTLESRLQRVVEGGRAASAEVEAASNTRAAQIRSYQVNFYPLSREGAGEAHGGVGMVIADITARKRAERMMRESEERFRSLVEASAASIWSTDAEGRFAVPQTSWMHFTGQTAAESQGWGRIDALHPEDHDRTRTAWEAGKATSTPIALENRVRRHDGAWRHMAVSIVPVLEEDGTVREWIGSHTDITDRKEAEMALAQARDAAEAANRAKSSFLANMSHELRTPLSAVIGYSEMLEEEAEELGEGAMLTDLGKIKSNAKHLLSLINDVLDLSKVEANKMESFAEDIEVEAFLRDAASTVEALVHRKRNSLALDLGPALGTMHSDAVKLRQCLFNLLSNAAKFTENGTITLMARREPLPEGDWLVFAVRDTGIGMSAEQMSRLFERFTQADETTTRKFGGTGLGLALSRAFARLLGGDILVHSQEGQGTTFTLRVPASIAVAAADTSGLSSAILAQPANGELVLVVDDEAAQRELMTRFLHRQGFRVEVAADGRTGLDLARALKPRVILLDVMMPGMDGWTVLAALKADPATADIPVVMVSFVADAGLSASLGAADAVPKPVDWDRLKAVIGKFHDAGGDVLVVDDDADMRQRLRSVLEKNGWRVGEAGNGEEALARVEQAPPHLILLDLTMPVMDGFAFLHHLRARPGGADIPVIVLSARDITPTERDRLQEADRIFRKGETSLRELAAEVRVLDDKRQSEAGAAEAAAP